MARVSEIYNAMCALAPLSLALDFDNPGFLVGEKDAEVTKVLVTLDITKDAVTEAQTKGAELIVSHHPVIFSPISRITDESITGEVLLSLIRGGQSAICMHTNLDAAQGGVSDCLAQAIGLSHIQSVPEEPLLRIGEVAPCTMQAFLAQISDGLKTDGLRYCGEKTVHRVGVAGGAAGDFAALAFAMGCDTFVTGEVKHHQWQDACENNLIEAGHFATEAPVCSRLVSYLQETFPDLQVFEAASNQDPAKYYSR